MTEYLVTAGIWTPAIYRCKSQIDAICYAEMYADRHITNVFVRTNDGLLVFSIDVIDGKLYQTDYDAQQAEWEEFVEEEHG